MIKQRAEIIASQAKKVTDELNTLLNYLAMANTDLERAKEEEVGIQTRIDEYRKKEEYYQSAEKKLQEARELQFELTKEKERVDIERGLIEKEKQVDRERKVRLDALDQQLRAKQQRLQSIIVQD